MTKPILIKAGSPILKLGNPGTPPKVDCRVVAEDLYKTMYTEEECKNMIFEYSQFMRHCEVGDGIPLPVDSWFERNKKI